MNASRGFGVYVHWPYCRAICPYCDFNVRKDREGGRETLLPAILDDIAGWRARTNPGPAGSLYFGGGTPSRLAPGDVEQLIHAVDAAWGLKSGAEVTLELNPEDAQPGALAGWRAAGVNRLSIGAQSLDNAALTALGRWHSAAQIREAYEHAQRVFDRLSLDFIYAREGQTLRQWEVELSDALALGAEHYALYQLTIEPGTAFAAKAARGSLTPPNADLAADFYELTQSMCAEAGLPAYEVSNHARGAAARSEHNMTYWRSGEWAGVGPGAHGRLGALGDGRRATEAERDPAAYIARVEREGWGVANDHALSTTEQADELLVMGLRAEEGLMLDAYAGLNGAPVSAEALEPLMEAGLVSLTGSALRVTPTGRGLTDGIARQLGEG